jgi:hypothetical protein
MSAFSSASFRQARIEPVPAFSALQAVRAQAAFLRSLLDEVERLAPRSAGADGLSDQIVEELARLGCTSLEAAAELTKLLAAARADA